MSDMRIGVVRATAMAAANAVIKHTKQGLFISQYVITDETLIKPAKFISVGIDGRADRGEWIYTKNLVVYKDGWKLGFPIEKVFVSTPDPARTKMTDPHVHFECTFGVDDIIVKRLEKSVFEDVAVSDLSVFDMDVADFFSDQRFRELNVPDHIATRAINHVREMSGEDLRTQKPLNLRTLGQFLDYYPKRSRYKKLHRAGDQTVDAIVKALASVNLSLKP